MRFILCFRVGGYLPPGEHLCLSTSVPPPHRQANPRQIISFGICDVCVDRLLLLVLLLYFAEFSAERRADRRRI